MKELKHKQAITLIALIITVIILLILAGLTINMVLGENGLFNKAKTSVGKYENSHEKENGIIARYETEIDNARDTITINKDEYEKLISDIEMLKNQYTTKYPDYTNRIQIFNRWWVVDYTETYTASENGFINYDITTRNQGHTYIYIDDVKIGLIGVRGVSDCTYNCGVVPIKKGSTFKIVSWNNGGGNDRVGYTVYFIPEIK